MKKLSCFIAICLLSSWCFSFMANGEENVVLTKTVSSEQSNSLLRENSYAEYSKLFDEQDFGKKEIIINSSNITNKSGDVTIEQYQGKQNVILTGEESEVEFSFSVEQKCLYNIEIQYISMPGKNTSVERSFWINGELPFSEAETIQFERVWTNEGEIQEDNRGNQITPTQKEVFMPISKYAMDSMGYFLKPFAFQFNEGNNTLTLKSEKEPIAILEIKLNKQAEVADYSTVQQEYKDKNYSEIKNFLKFYPAEDAQFKSEPTILPANDRTTPLVSPYSPSELKLNTLGGNNWKTPGQWVQWKVNVPESGLYQIGLKAKQNITRGISSCRKIKINGKVPFSEAETILFQYSTDYKNVTFGTEEEPYLFYLEKGENTIEMETTLGPMADILQVADEIVFELNAAYRRIVMITGSTPDTNRDYQIDKKMPEIIDVFKETSSVLNELSKQILDLTGEKGSGAAILDTFSYQLQNMVEKPHSIAKRLAAFKNNVSSLSDWIITAREQPLQMDYLWVCSVDTKEEDIPRAEANFFESLKHEMTCFFLSFIQDYAAVGNVYEGGTPITLWVTSGRDQAQIIKRLIDDTFIPTYQQPVNLKLVAAGVLLSAVVAGRGPDVAMQVVNSDPVNYALRNAVIDLKQFSDFDEVANRFMPSALVPYTFNDGIYALPETQTFPMMFYRADILDELGLQVPETWDDLYTILPDIQKNNMDIAIPTSSIDTPNAGLTSFLMLLYQMGGELYVEDGKQIALDSDMGINAFKTWTELYENYKFPLEINFANRFRSGEVPLGIADYTLYNTLSVFAPEIKGMWGMAPVPGMRKDNGEIDRSVGGGGVGVMMLKNSQDLNMSWNLMKWWTSEDVQVRFGQELESIMGAAARYPTANVNAMQKIAWRVSDYKALTTQWKAVKGTPEVPGSYFVPRHIDNAFRRVVYYGEPSSEVLLDYTEKINREIESKRKEFKLDE